MKISTITATATPNKVIDARLTFNAVETTAGFDTISFYCQDDGIVKTKFAHQQRVDITKNPKRFPPQQLSVKIAGINVSVFRSGQILVVGAKCPSDVQRAIDTISEIAHVDIDSFEYRMINAGFRLNGILVNCAALCRLWNLHFSQYGIARYDGERHAAVHIKMIFADVVATVMVFRTGTVQVLAARHLSDLESCQKMIVYCLSSYRDSFSMLDQPSASTTTTRTRQKPT